MQLKSLTIQIPQLRWRILIPLLLFASAFCYWFFAIYPYLWIDGAKVEALALSVRSDHSGRVVELGPREGEAVQKGGHLFSFDATPSRIRQEELELRIHSLNEQLHQEQLEMDRAMQHYLESPQEEHFSLFEEAQKRSEKVSSELAALQTEQDSLKQQVQKQSFHAPFDGFVLKRMAEEGANLSLGDTAYVLCDPTHFWIEAQIPEQYLSRVSVGAPIQVFLPAFPNKKWKGTISWIAPAVTASSIPIRISVGDSTFPVKSGLSAKLRLKIH